MTTANPHRLSDALRACARGIHPLEAGTGLLIDCGSWLHREDFTSRFIITGTSISDGTTVLAATDWEAAVTALRAGELPASGGERRMLLLAASIAGGIPVSLYDTLPGIDHRNASLVIKPSHTQPGKRICGPARHSDPAVAGVALVGSLGRGEEDNWSDIDLLVLASGQLIRQFMNKPAASPWARADVLSDGRHNSPAGATSLGTTHIRSGLPLRVDLHVHPADRTPWPTDSRVLFERRPVKTGTLSFGEFNASGPRQPATAKTADEVRQIHLGYVPTAGSYIGRRSPRACEMIRFLGQRRDFNDRDPAAQIRTLRGIAKDLSSPSWGQLGDAVASYLNLVEATVQLGGE